MRYPIIEVYGHSDIGLNRNNNEDVWLSIPEYRFFAIADGMGGHRAGEIAAKEALETLEHSIVSFFNPNLNAFLTIGEIVAHLRTAIDSANKQVYDLASEIESYKGMGTTLCCCYLFDDSIIYANVGDSRIYRFRENKLKQLTNDHSLTNQLISYGYLENDSVAYRNILTKAIGTSPRIEPNIATLPVKEGDIYFLCSDGLTDFVKEEEIAMTLATSHTLKGSVERLIEAAKNNNGSDNITVGMILIKAFYDDLS